MNCFICDRLKKTKYFVKDMKTGIVVIGDNQQHKGYTLFLAKEHVSELHELSDRNLHLKEMAIVAEAVYRAFNPNKLNCELLGNTHSHLHWHIVPRKDNKSGPMWLNWKEMPPTDKELVDLKNQLKEYL